MRGRRWLYLFTVLLFALAVSRFYVPGAGFSPLILLGDGYSRGYLPELRAADPYIQEGSDGYDAQWYVQIAIRPDITDPQMKEAIDNLAYRARRSLLAWTAHVLGFGRPAWVIQAYALQNVVSWLLLAWLLLRWFPPDGPWENYFRWAAVLCSYGLAVSVRASLVDGPSLLMIVLAVLLTEKRLGGWAALVLGLAGLGKETNLVAIGGVLDRPEQGRPWQCMFEYGKRALVIVTPLALWTAYIVANLGSLGTNAGVQNFALPFVEYGAAVSRTVSELWTGQVHRGAALAAALALISLTAQWAFFVLRPRLSEPWWRVAIGYAALMMLLGKAVWEGYPGAATRVLLPMLLAFNVLVPKGARWWPLLLVGNLTIFTTPELLRMPGGSGFAIEAPAELRRNATTQQPVAVFFDATWRPAEKTWWDYWRWGGNPATFKISNPHPFSIEARLAFAVATAGANEVRLLQEGKTIWTGRSGSERVPGEVAIVVPPGGTALRLECSPNLPPSGTDSPVIRLFDLTVSLGVPTR